MYAFSIILEYKLLEFHFSETRKLYVFLWKFFHIFNFKFQLFLQPIRKMNSTTTITILLIIGFLPTLIIADHLDPGAGSNPGPVARSSLSFWIRTAVEQLHVRDACISAQLCAEPRRAFLIKFNIKIFKLNFKLNSKISIVPFGIVFFIFWCFFVELKLKKFKYSINTQKSYCVF